MTRTVRFTDSLIPLWNSLTADPKKALRKAKKIAGEFTPLQSETFERKYLMDDETFIRLATLVE